jgi:cytochrome c oxidase assembly protein subunit 15
MSQSQTARAAPELHILPGTPPAPVAAAVRVWLFAIAGLCFLVAVVGAITRLTESGLSMVEWKPLIQDIPPLSDAEWQAVFAKYKLSPQYILQTNWMTLGDFKGIFWWEWTHRLIAQFIGAAFAVPFLYFLARRQLPKRLVPYLIGLFILGGLQGLLGWAMVASGLVDRPSVSHYRLAAHLSMDLTIYSLTLWTAFFVSRPRAAALTPAPHQPILQRHAIAGLAALAITIVWGAFTAGLRQFLSARPAGPASALIELRRESGGGAVRPPYAGDDHRPDTDRVGPQAARAHRRIRAAQDRHSPLRGRRAADSAGHRDGGEPGSGLAGRAAPG